MKKFILTAALASIALLASHVFLAQPARADGKIFARAETNSNPSTTWQEAVIIHDGSTERLILQVNFEGRGKDFVWIIPTPAVPQVSLERPYIFRVLKHVSEPDVRISGYMKTFKAIVYPVAIIIIYLTISTIQKLVRPGLKRDLAFFLLGFFSVIVWTFVYWLHFATFGKSDIGRTDSGVTVHEKKDLGVYETTTLSATNAADLVKWLRDNNYAMPDGSLSIFKYYVDKGWHFTAVKIASEKDEEYFTSDENGQTPPLSLAFPSKEIVFPLKITSLARQKSMVMLYVLAPSFIKADRFKLMYANITPPGPLGLSSPLSDRADHFTRLWARFNPNKMEDVTLKIDPDIDEFKATFYTQEFKTDSLLTFVIGILALLVIWVLKQKLAWKILFTVPVILSMYEQHPVLSSITSSTPFNYYETHDNLKYPPFGRGEANHVLEEIYSMQQQFRNQHGAYAATFKELDYYPEAKGFTFYLSPDEFYPPAPINPYSFFFTQEIEREIGIVHRSNRYDWVPVKLDSIFPSPEIGFAALAIGSRDDEAMVSFTLINQDFDKQ